jgi:curli biogenesis system outer membrane secretion channel CsgG
MHRSEKNMTGGLSMIGKNGFKGLLVLLGVLLGAVCVMAGTKATVTSGQDSPTINQAQDEAYNGPKARVAVARFKDKTGKGWWTGEIGDGMADQLTTALFNTNHYIVLEREVLKDVMSEQDLGASGRVRRDTAAPIGQIEGAELLVVGAVTEFEGNASGAQGGLGGFGGKVLGGIMGGFKKAHMAIDVRVIDTKTSRVLAATTVEGEATDMNLGGLLGGYGSAGALAGGLSGWKNTPTEKALRVCIKEAVNFVVSKTPQKYYHN